MSRVGWAQSSPNRTTQPVKQFEEFLKRFYYQQTPDQHPLTTDSLKALYPRRSYLLSLFDANDSRRNEPTFRRAVDAFATEMADSDEQPTDLYAQLLAETSFQITFHGRPQSLTACWQMVRANKAQGWRLVGLNAPFLEKASDVNSAESDSLSSPKPTLAIPNDTIRNRPLTVAPNAHETSFLAFHSMVKQGHDIRLLMSDSLSQTAAGQALARAVYQHRLTVTETERVTFYVLTRPGWVVRVNEFPRDADNSGWLISDLYGPLSPSKLPPELVTLLRATQ